MALADLTAYGSGLAAAIAAGLWLWSATVRLPTMPPGSKAMQNARGADTMAALFRALGWQSRLSAYAAISAAAAALLQILAVYLAGAKTVLGAAAG